jgi:DUF1009 family protein
MNEAVETIWDMAAAMGMVVNACKILVGNLKEIDRLDDLDVDGRIILYYNIIMDLEVTESTDVKLVRLGQVRNQWQHPITRQWNLRFP